MDRKRLATRITDMGRVLDRFESPVLGSHFRVTLPISRIVRLLISIQGQDIIKRPVLESISHKEIGLTPLELHRTYLPLFQEWGFVRTYQDRIEETIKSRADVLERVGKWWEESDPHDTEKLGVELFDVTATAPRTKENVEKIINKFDEKIGKSAVAHLSGSGLVDKLSLSGADWYYSPEILGEDYKRAIKFISSRKEEERTKVYETVESVLRDQGIPHGSLMAKIAETKIDEIVGAGLLMGYPIIIGDISNIFYFTPDLRNRFDGEGRGDKFELIKTGVSHFQYAYHLANVTTGKLKFNPYVLLEKLIEKGEAGNATAISTDYGLLVQKGLVKIQPTFGTRSKFILPDSKEKIADLEAIRDVFKDRWVVPKIDFSSMGVPSNALAGDPLVYRSRRVMKGRELMKEFMQEVLKL
jgi:hypothetical protein